MMTKLTWCLLLQDRLFAATGDHLQLVVFDRLDASRILTAHNVDATLHHVTVIDDAVKDPAHGQYRPERILLYTVGL